MTREQWQEWQNLPATKAVREAVLDRIEESKDQIVFGAQNDRDFDQFTKGMIRAFVELLQIEPDLIIEDDKDEIPTRDTGTSDYSETED